MMGQSSSSVRSRSSRQRSFRSFARRSKLNKSNLSHTFNLPPSDEHLELMNVNTATEEQLMTLPGVNRQLARAIVCHRHIIGRFKRIDDLALVSGVGAEKLEVLRPEICTGPRKSISRTSSYSQSLDSMRTSNESKLCSINTSSVFQLQCVPGLNQEIAANIVDYRNKKGPFKSLDDLIKVKGMNVVRLSTVKPYLSLNTRKCESMQQLPNSNPFLPNSQLYKSSYEINSPVNNNSLSSMQMTLPNGFAAAPVNDILDLLSAYSHRPVIDSVFTYERDGVKCFRLASWNLHELSLDKITNPGVREVVCRTILENKFSIIAIQDVIEEVALKFICDELNYPQLRRVKEWASNGHRWEYTISKQPDTRRLGFIFDASTTYIRIEDIRLDQVYLLNEASEARQLTDLLIQWSNHLYPQAFLLYSRPMIMVNLHCQKWFDDEMVKVLAEVAELSHKSGLQVICMGEFLEWGNIKALKSWQPVLKDDTNTSVENSLGSSMILRTDTEEGTMAGLVRNGLRHLAIPRGWSWGGPASPYCPVWTEVKLHH